MDKMQHPSAGEATATTTLAGAGKAATKPAAKPEVAPSPPLSRLQLRRRFVWTAVGGFLAANFLMFLRFFFPRTLFEPSTRFRIGFPSEFGLGVDERFKQSHRIWVVRSAGQVIRSRCQMHPPGMHAELAGSREQIQVSVPWQWLRHGGQKLRRTGAASHGSRPRGTGCGRSDRGRYRPAVRSVRRAENASSRRIRIRIW